jgi:hypothetical protein
MLFFLLEQGKSPVGFLASKCEDESKIQEMRFSHSMRPYSKINNSLKVLPTIARADVAPKTF